MYHKSIEISLYIPIGGDFEKMQIVVLFLQNIISISKILEKCFEKMLDYYAMIGCYMLTYSL